MKRNVLVILFFVCLGSVFAQDLFITADSFEKEFQMQDGESLDEIIHSTFRHELGGERTFVWERTEEYLSAGWETAVCDNNRCYLPTVSTQTFNAGSGDENTMDIHTYTNGVQGDSVRMTIKIYEEGNPDVSVSQTYTFRNNSITSSKDIEYQSISVFPNPASEYFKIENDNFVIKNLHVYNITGKLVAQYDTTDRNEYDISHLAKGAYFVRMNGENKTLKTVRLNII